MHSATAKRQKVGLHWQIALACLITFLVSFIVVFYMNRRISSIVTQMDGTYSANRQLTEGKLLLDSMQQELDQYLSTRSDTALEAFREHTANADELLVNLNQDPVMDSNGILEKNIVTLFAGYQRIAEDAIFAKESRDLDTYQSLYTGLEKHYNYLTDMIATLNSRRFEENTIDYENVMRSARLSGVISFAMLFLIAAMDILLLVLLTRITQRDAQLKENAMREQEISAKGQIKEAQLRYLQAQINPHFLFNTLNAGAQLAMMEDADRTYAYIHKVADFYRYVSGRDEAVTTLADEIRLIDDFIYILNVRFGGDITYSTEIADDVCDFQMPRMILQPIVENAIKHGFEEKEGEKQIRITGEREGDRIIVRVSDNGAGMTEERIREVMCKALKATGLEDGTVGIDGTGGIGTSNVLARLRMYYNTDDVIEIQSPGPGQGTTFVLRLPE